MQIPTLPNEEKQKELFKEIETLFWNEFYMKLTPIKSWAEYEGLIMDYNKRIQEDNN